MCIGCLLPCITPIVNQSISECVVPVTLKSASVTPLIKKANLDPDDMKNYRPVSNLSYISKLIERVVVAQLQTHMKDNSLNPVYQSAYRKHHSTETALIKISNDILCEMDDGKCSLVVALHSTLSIWTYYCIGSRIHMASLGQH